MMRAATLPRSPAARRWAISFADLSLLIACILFVGWRPDTDAAAAGAPATLLASLPTAQLFADGDAMLTTTGARQLRSMLGEGQAGQRLAISVGTAGTRSIRLDQWELAAARTATIARAVHGRHRLRLDAPHDGRDVRIVVLR